MRGVVLSELKAGRFRSGPYASDDSYGLTGAFEVRGLLVISSGGDHTWEHVSVSLKDRCPTWEEMVFIKDLFWRDDETVIQFHPRKSEYVNNHPYVLHLWKPPYEVKLPPSILVGVKLKEKADG